MLVLCLGQGRVEADLPHVEDFRGMVDMLEVCVRQDDLLQQERLTQCRVPLLLKITDERVFEWPWRLQPHMVDIPWQMGRQGIERVREKFPTALVQGSSHDEGNPKSIFLEMKQMGFDAIKIAQPTPAVCDVLKLLSLLQTCVPGERLTCVPMGEASQLGRLLAVRLGSHLSFCCLPGLQTAAGQLDVITMHTVLSGGLCQQL